MRTEGWKLALAVAVVAVAACARTETPQLHGGETNWLRSCSDDSDCDLGSCICGVCTAACEGPLDCDGDFAGPCIDAGSRIGAAACDGSSRTIGLCLPDCADDRACGDGFACRDGACVTGQVAAELDRPDIEVVKSGCTVQPCASDSPGCELEMVSQRLPVCLTPGLTPVYEARCGSYRAIVVQGIDSAVVHYYDAEGIAVGQSEAGFGASGCKAYNPSFKAVDCEIVTPACSAADGGVRPEDAGEGGDAEVMACMYREAPTCASGEPPICTLAGMRALVPECWSREVLPPYREVRCGEYTGIIAQGEDSQRILFYDAGGALVGENEEGLFAGGCTAYDSAFRLSPCEMVTPECPPGEACTVSAGPLCEPFDDPLCALDTARSRVPECRTPFATATHEVQCGEYAGIVAQGIDSRTTFLYSADGTVVARKDEEPDAVGCVARDAAFRFPACTTVTPDCAEPVCDCSAEEVSLDCVCSLIDCPTYEEAIANPLCQAGNPNPTLIARGCGMITVRFSAGLSSRSFVYEGPDQELAGASFTDDVPLGECGRNGYRTALPNLEACDDYAVCALCEFSGYETCGSEP